MTLVSFFPGSFVGYSVAFFRSSFRFEFVRRSGLRARMPGGAQDVLTVPAEVDSGPRLRPVRGKTWSDLARLCVYGRPCIHEAIEGHRPPSCIGYVPSGRYPKVLTSVALREAGCPEHSQFVRGNRRYPHAAKLRTEKNGVAKGLSPLFPRSHVELLFARFEVEPQTVSRDVRALLVPSCVYPCCVARPEAPLVARWVA